jgi:putative glutamine amidotransferase
MKPVFASVTALCGLLVLFGSCRDSPPPAEPVALPLVGITFSDSPRDAAAAAALERAGARWMLLRPADDALNPPALTDLDGLVLSGGPDIDPSLYGEPPGASLSLLDPARQRMDMALARRAETEGLPVLGLCLGAQELAVADGGTLIQDIPTEVGTTLDHHAPHAVNLEPGSLLASIYETSRITVISNHHQAVDMLGRDLVVAARADDGVIEAFVGPDHPFLVGVQYHPEMELPGEHVQDVLWSAFVKATRTRAEAMRPEPTRSP